MNLSSRVQRLIHLLALIVTPLVLWAYARGYITKTDLTWWGTYVVGASGLALVTSLPVSIGGGTTPASTSAPSDLPARLDALLTRVESAYDQAGIPAPAPATIDAEVTK